MTVKYMNLTESNTKDVINQDMNTYECKSLESPISLYSARKVLKSCSNLMKNINENCIKRQKQSLYSSNELESKYLASFFNTA